MPSCRHDMVHHMLQASTRQTLSVVVTMHNVCWSFDDRQEPSWVMQNWTMLCS